MPLLVENSRSRAIRSVIRGPVVLAVMDGVGVGRPGFPYDAVARARTPNLDILHQRGLYTELVAHGQAVGLPSKDDIGNSEVGHMMLGAGRVIEQGPTMINKQIADGSFFRSQTLNELIDNSVQNDKPLHLIGLLQRIRPVHSHTDHLKAIVEYAYKRNVQKVFVHGLTDGRDDPDGEAINTMSDIEMFLSQFNGKNGRVYRIASGGGRMHLTMDRYWAEPEMLKRGWETHVLGIGEYQFSSGTEAVTALKVRTGKQDQWLPSFVITENGEPIGKIRGGDSVIFFNFRGDRAIEFSSAIEKDNFDFFDRGPKPNVLFAGMMAYDSEAGIPSRAIVSPPIIDRTICELMAGSGILLHEISETQKYGHVTYFFRGLRQEPFDTQYEYSTEIPSAPTETFEFQPQMKAKEITQALMRKIAKDAFAFGIVNYPNGDMVGHTGNFDSTLRAIETVDRQVGRLMEAIERAGGALIVTADHGNADEMVEADKAGKILLKEGGEVRPRTGHTTNKVPFYVYAPSVPEGIIAIAKGIENPSICNIASSALALLGFERPEHMERGLIEFKN